MKKKRNYDKRVKLTRIFLDDYLVVKGLGRQAGISMAEALHKLIIGLKPEPKPEREPVAVATKPAFIIKAPVALRVRPEPVLTTNGHKAGVLVTKPKGGIIQ
ncbi:hypothetical protein ES705_44884 [subsurface metagenome]